MKTATNKASRPQRGRKPSSCRKAERGSVAPDLAGLQALMQMQNRMAKMCANLPPRSMFDGIPDGASPYYFYSMTGRKE